MKPERHASLVAALRRHYFHGLRDAFLRGETKTITTAVLFNNIDKAQTGSESGYLEFFRKAMISKQIHPRILEMCVSENALGDLPP